MQLLSLLLFFIVIHKCMLSICVIPAQAGIQKLFTKLDSCFHRNDNIIYLLNTSFIP